MSGNKAKTVFILTYTGSNYGTYMQNYALAEKINALGFHAKTIRWGTGYYNSLGIQRGNLQIFYDKYIEQTPPCFLEKELKDIIKHGDIVIIGGDQVFRQMYFLKNDYIPLLRFYGDFIDGRKVLASYAASFGIDRFEGDNFLTNECRKLLKRFDLIGVREKSGLDILKNTFGVDGEEVLDPVFFFKHDKYDKLIDLCQDVIPRQDAGKYIGYMCFNDGLGRGIDDINEALINNLNKDSIVKICSNDEGQYTIVEQWLYNIKHARCIITNSFHCTCFAIIYKKPLIVPLEGNSGNDRLINLLNNLKLGNCIKERIGDITYDDINNLSIDWATVDNHLQDRELSSEKFLKKILSVNPTNKKPYKNEILRKIRSKYENVYKYRLKARYYSDKASKALIMKITLKHRLLRIIIKCLVKPNVYKKLKKHPVLFFRDSNSAFIRWIGLFYL